MAATHPVTAVDTRPPALAENPTPTTVPPGRWWPRTAEAFVYLAVALLLIAPVSVDLGNRIVGQGDSEFWMWLCWRLGRLVSAGHLLPLQVPDAVWPYGSNLLLNDGNLGALIGAYWNVLLPPILAFNVTVLTALLLNMWAGRILARQLTSSRAVVMICAIAFASAPALTIRLDGHFNLIFAFPVALLVAAAIAAARDHRVRWVQLALLLFIAYLSSIYYLLFGAIAVAMIVLGARISWRDRGRTALRLAMAVALCAAMMTPFIVARLQLERAETSAGRPPASNLEPFLYSSDATSILTVPAQSVVQLPGFDAVRRGPNGLEATAFPGFLLLLGGGALMLFRHPLRRGLLLAASGMYVLSLGPTLRVNGSIVDKVHGAPAAYLPYELLLSLPGLNALRTPNRVSFTLVAVLTAGLAIGLGWLWPRLRLWHRSGAVAVCILLLIVNVIPKGSATLQLTASTETALRQIAADPNGGDSVLVAPSDCTAVGTEAVKLQIIHQHPVVGCQAATAAIPFYSNFDLYAKSAGLASLRCDPTYVGLRKTAFATRPAFDSAAIAEVHRDLGVRYLIVERLAFDSACAAVATEIAHTTAGGQVLGEDATWIIIDLKPLEQSP